MQIKNLKNIFFNPNNIFREFYLYSMYNLTVFQEIHHFWYISGFLSIGEHHLRNIIFYALLLSFCLICWASGLTPLGLCVPSDAFWTIQVITYWIITRQLWTFYSRHADLWVQTGGTPWSWGLDGRSTTRGDASSAVGSGSGLQSPPSPPERTARWSQRAGYKKEKHDENE